MNYSRSSETHPFEPVLGQRSASQIYRRRGLMARVLLDARRRIGRPQSHSLKETLSKPAREKQDDGDNQEDTDETVAAVTKAVAGAAEAATEATEQEDNEDNDEDGSERHDYLPLPDLTACWASS